MRILPLGIAMGALPLLYYGALALYENNLWQALHLAGVGGAAALLLAGSFLLAHDDKAGHTTP